MDEFPNPAQPEINTADAAIKPLPRGPRADNTGSYNVPEGGAEPKDERIVADNGVRDRNLVPQDALYLSVNDRADFGVPDAVLSGEVDRDPTIPGDRVIVAIRDPGDYDGVEKNRIRQFHQQNPGGEVIRENGKPYGHGDLIYATIPRALYDERRRMHDRACMTATDQLAQKRIVGPEGDLEEFPTDQAGLKRKRDETHAMLASSIVEKRPRNMSYEDVLHFEGAERTAEIEKQFARGGRSLNAKEREEMATERAARIKESERKGSRRVFGYSGGSK